jgi:hypothetical protein
VTCECKLTAPVRNYCSCRSAVWLRGLGSADASRASTDATWRAQCNQSEQLSCGGQRTRLLMGCGQRSQVYGAVHPAVKSTRPSLRTANLKTTELGADRASVVARSRRWAHH